MAESSALDVFKKLCEATGTASIEEYEQWALDQPQVDMGTKETFIGSLYVREIFIPKDTIITSRVYKRAYVDIMLSGKITINDSSGVYTLEGPNILEGPPGRKRAGYAIEDTRWVTVHDALEVHNQAEVIEQISLESLKQWREYQAAEDNQDFDFLLESLGIDSELVKKESENPNTYEPALGDDFYLAVSAIHGTGLFAARRFAAGEVLGFSLQSGKRTEGGRYVNHSAYPNSVNLGLECGDVVMVALRQIEPGQEITADYGVTLANTREVLTCQEF